MRCQCNASVHNVDRAQGSEGKHRTITFCSGPVMRRNVTQASRGVDQSEKEIVDRFEVKCRESWHDGRVDGGA